MRPCSRAPPGMLPGGERLCKLFTPAVLHREDRLVSRVGERGTVHAERLYRVAGFAMDRELAQDLADEARELEAVAGPVEHGDVVMFRQPAEHDLAVWRPVVEAGLG